MSAWGPIDVWLPCALSLVCGLVTAFWLVPLQRTAVAPLEMSPELLEAMSEVDALLPNTPPISPQMSAAQRRAIEDDEKRRRFIASLVPPTATAAGVWPRCRGAGGCGYHHRKGIPCGQALIERRPPPPPPQRPAATPAPGPGRLGSR